MVTQKQRTLQMIQSLPDDCTFENIQYHVSVCVKVQRGIEAIDKRQIVSQAEAEQRIKEWFK